MTTKSQFPPDTTVHPATGRVDAFLRQRLGAILHHPDGWGPPHAVELQILLLVEMVHVSDGKDLEHVNETAGRWWKHVSAAVGPGPQTLSSKLGLGDRATEQFAEVVRSFLSFENVVLPTKEAPSPPSSPGP